VENTRRIVTAPVLSGTMGGTVYNSGVSVRLATSQARDAIMFHRDAGFDFRKT